jgi:HEAT repeat protein
MNHLLGMLAGGDLRSDGMSNEVTEIVLANPGLFDDLYEGLRMPDDVVRGRTADAIEKIARSRPELLVEHRSELIELARFDSVAMVRWHIAMILGYLAIFEDLVGEINTALVELLGDGSVFVRSWAIVSLSIIGRKYPDIRDGIVKAISPLQLDSSVAIRTKVRYSLAVLADDDVPFPPGWVKSESLLM